jgi:hypothetical protein
VRRPDFASDSRTVDRTDTTSKSESDEPGHWRNRWRVPPEHEHFAREQGALPLGDGTWLGNRKFATSEDAEKHAAQFIDYNRTHFDIVYLGTEFFPEY